MAQRRPRPEDVADAVLAYNASGCRHHGWMSVSSIPHRSTAGDRPVASMRWGNPGSQTVPMHAMDDREPCGIAPGQRSAPSAPPRLGIIGGGQLAKMTALACAQLGVEVAVLERHNYGPAVHLAARALVGDWDQPEALLHLARQVDVVTLENEFVDATSLATL